MGEVAYSFFFFHVTVNFFIYFFGFLLVANYDGESFYQCIDYTNVQIMVQDFYGIYFTAILH